MVDEFNWAVFHQKRQRLYAETQLDFVRSYAYRNPAAHDRIEAEYANLVRVGDWLRKNEKWSELNGLVAALGEESGFIQDRGPRSETIPLLEAGLESARALADPVLINTRLNTLGEALYAVGQIEPALKLHQEALRLAEQLDNPAFRRATLYALGHTYTDYDVAQARSYLVQAHEMQPRPPSDPSLEIDLLTALTTVYTLQGEFEAAITYLDQGLKIAHQTQDIRRQADLFYTRGYLHYTMENLAEAEANFVQAARLAEQLGNSAAQARIRQAMGAIALQLGQPHRAVTELEQALKANRQTADSGMLPFILAALGEAYMALKEFEQARSYLTQTLTISQKFNSIPAIAGCEEQARQALAKISDLVNNRKE